MFAIVVTGPFVPISVGSPDRYTRYPDNVLQLEKQLANETLSGNTGTLNNPIPFGNFLNYTSQLLNIV